MKGKRPYLILICILLAVDQATKLLIERTIALGGMVTVIPGFVNLRHVRNRGAIFGFLAETGSPWVLAFLLAASIAALIFILFYFFKTPAANKGIMTGLTLIATGALGNQADRILKGYVVDFLDLHIKNAHWPFFNVADSCITIGTILLMIMFVFGKKKGEADVASA